MTDWLSLTYPRLVVCIDASKVEKSFIAWKVYRATEAYRGGSETIYLRIPEREDDREADEQQVGWRASRFKLYDLKPDIAKIRQRLAIRACPWSLTPKHLLRCTANHPEMYNQWYRLADLKRWVDRTHSYVFDRVDGLDSYVASQGTAEHDFPELHTLRKDLFVAVKFTADGVKIEPMPSPRTA